MKHSQTNRIDPMVFERSDDPHNCVDVDVEEAALRPDADGDDDDDGDDVTAVVGESDAALANGDDDGGDVGVDDQHRSDRDPSRHGKNLRRVDNLRTDPRRIRLDRRRRRATIQDR